jgi:arginyl-tRNA synthetase
MNPLVQAVIGSLKPFANVDEAILEMPPSPELGDYALPCFMLAKQLKQSPQKIAEDLAKKIQRSEILVDVQSKGPYLNFFLNKSKLAEYGLTAVNGEGFGRGTEAKTVMVEFSSPNTNKPLHLGHVRNIVIGQSVSKILRFSGNKVITACLVNDRGIHITKSMLAYERWGGNKLPHKKSDHFVGDFYVLFSQKEKEDAAIEDEAQELLRKWEAGDKKVRTLWKKMNKWAETGFAETYTQMGVKFDTFYYESDIYDKGKDIVTDALNRGVFVKVDGAVTAKLDPMPDKVVMRADGTSLYVTQDLYLAEKKFQDYNLDQSIYVVGSEQNLHFQQLFRILELLGFQHAKDCYHLSYGMVYLPEGRMKSREGTVVDADDIMAEMIKLAGDEVKKRHEKLSPTEVKRRGRAIGLGALKFFMLKTDAGKDMTFDPNESISFEGETGPYVQYAYARIASIRKKHKGKIGKADYSLLGDDELPLIRKLLAYPEAVAQARKHHKPSIVCRYLLDLAQLFNEYYHKVPILKAEPALCDARLYHITTVQAVLKSGLALLDIDVLEQM